MMGSSRYLGYGAGLLGAVVYGVAQVVIKHISGFSPPLVGAAFALLFGGGLLLPLMLVTLPGERQAPTSAYWWAALAGVVTSLGVVFIYLAMSKAPVSVVSPISAINPLVTMGLAYLFLRRSEGLSWRAAAGALLTVGGVVVIGIFRNG
ncbi:MAG: DMT family transporter [Chloroflexi bacterium]|nr:DMT family transporter [Chloroflexota bacterium]